MIYVLAILLIVLLIISYFLYKKDIVAPAFVFTLSFTFSVCWAVLYAKKWNLDSMYIKTFLVIIGGTIEFNIIASIIQNIYELKHKNDYLDKKEEIDLIDISKTIKLICICFAIIVLILDLQFILKTTQGNIWNLKNSISKYDSLVKFSKLIVKPNIIVRAGLTIIHILSYWFLYIFVNNFISSKKIDVLSGIFIILNIIISLINGGRNGTVNLILAGICFTYILLKKKNSYKEKIKLSKRVKIAIIIIPILFLVTFPYAAKLLGRNIQEKTTDYLAIYCGAEIKNLDIFLREKEIKSKYNEKNRNCQTFNVLMNDIGLKIGLIDKEYKLDLPFRRINGYSLGNVYTTFYPYIYDFGYVGMIVLTGIMAIITQCVYEKCKRENIKNIPSIWILIYGYMFSSILLSFFSNKFYEQNFSKRFLLSVLSWIVLNYLLTYQTEKNEKSEL